MEKQKKILTIILSIILIISMSIGVYAVEEATVTNFAVKLHSTSTNITKDKKVEVFVAVADFVDISSGINAFLGTLQYDENVLTLEQNIIDEEKVYGFESQNAWGTPIYNPENGKLSIESASMVKAEQDIIKIIFTINENVAIGTKTTITVSDVVTSDADNEYNGIKGSIQLTVIEKSKPDDGSGDGIGTNPPTGDEEENENPEDNNGSCTHEYEMKNNETQHYEICKKCNEEKSESRIKHTYLTYTDNKDGKHTSTCTGCGYQLTEAHNFVEKKCENCDAVEIEAGTNSGDEKGEGEGKDNNTGTTNKDETSADKNYTKAGISTVLLTTAGCIFIIAIILFKKNKKFEDIK